MTALSLRPIPDEDFVGFVSRQARYIGVHPNQLRKRLGLPQAGSARWPSLSKMIEAGRALQMDASTVTDMTLHRYPRELHELPVSGLFKGTRKQWVMNPSGRTCFKCLEEQPEMIFRDWSIGTSFACPKHHVLLDEHCRLCHPLTKYGPAPAGCRCADSRIGPETLHHLSISPATLHVQQRLHRLLAESRESTPARDTLVLTLHWLKFLARAGDATWPSEDDEFTRNMRLRINVHIEHSERELGRRAQPNARAYASSFTVAAYGGAALKAASMSIPEARGLYAETQARLRERNRPANHDGLLECLRSHEAPTVKRTHSEVTKDLLEASRRIADALNAHGLSIAQVPALLPPPHAQDLLEEIGAGPGQRLALLVVAHLGDMPKTKAAAYLGLPRSIALGFKGDQARWGPLKERTPLIAESLISEPRNYAKLRVQFAQVPTISKRDLNGFPTNAREIKLGGLDFLTSLQLWCWWQMTGSSPAHASLVCSQEHVWPIVRRVDAYLKETETREYAVTLTKRKLDEQQASIA